MREIVFRAWDGKKLSIGKAEYFDDSVNFRFEHFDIDCDKPILEQYTGLKDKNGKMIFEGDILQGDDDIEDDVFHVARIGQSDENRYECFLDFNGDNKCWMPFIRHFNRMEIIGNIHDQKEDV